MEIKIIELEEKYDKEIEKVIRDTLIEFGGNREGLAWADPMLGELSKVYVTEGNKYWIALNEKGEAIAGTGIGNLEGADGVCELQKMYCKKEYRGTGVAHKLIKIALEYAIKYYDRCYLETLSNMIAAHKFYEKYGFKRMDKPLIETEHYACDVWYIKELK